MRSKLLIALLLCLLTVSSDALVVVQRDAAGGGAVVWLENTAAQTTSITVSTTAAQGQRVFIHSNFTLNKIVVYDTTLIGTPIWTCRIGKTSDLTTASATFDEEWTDIEPTGTSFELVSVENPEYLTSDTVLYFACLETSGDGSCKLSYNDDELESGYSKRIYRTTGDPWNLNYANVANDLRFEIWQE